MKLKSFDEYLLAQLRDPEFAMLYLNEAYQDSVEEFLVALRKYVQANGGVSQVAASAQVSRESLYKMLSNTGNPELRSVRAVLQALGLRLTIGRVVALMNTEEAPEREAADLGRQRQEQVAA